MSTKDTIYSQIFEDTTLHVPAEYDTVEDALNFLLTKYIHQGAIVTIEVAAGTYSYTDSVTWYHPQAKQIIITGDASVSTTITGNSTITGSTGAWHEILYVSSTTGLNANDYVSITGIVPGASLNNPAVCGFHKIYSVDSSTQITIENTSRYASYGSLSKILSSGDVQKMATIFSFSGCDGIKIKSEFREISYIGVVGDNTTGTSGMLMGSEFRGTSLESVVENPLFASPTIKDVGIFGFGVIGSSDYYNNSGMMIAFECPSLTRISVSNCATGIAIGYGASLYQANYLYSTGNTFGIGLRYGGTLEGHYHVFSGNTSHGAFIQYSCKYGCYPQINSFTNDRGVVCMYGSVVYFNNYNYIHTNSSYGLYASTCARGWCANTGNVTGNGTADVYVRYMSRVDVAGASTYNPSAYTLGNYNSYIYKR